MLQLHSGGTYASCSTAHLQCQLRQDRQHETAAELKSVAQNEKRLAQQLRREWQQRIHACCRLPQDADGTCWHYQRCRVLNLHRHNLHRQDGKQDLGVQYTVSLGPLPIRWGVGNEHERAHGQHASGTNNEAGDLLLRLAKQLRNTIMHISMNDRDTEMLELATAEAGTTY